MHGAGNDYIYIYCPDGKIPGGDGILPEELAVSISDRHFGIGSDGLVLILPGSNGCDFTMRMFNNDGSEAQMCGNATRCIGRYVREHGLTDKEIVTLSTLAGKKVIHIAGCKDSDRGDVSADPIDFIEVDMGEPVFEPRKIPAAETELRGEYSVVKHGDFEAVCVSMGNPHGVIFLEDVATPLPEGELKIPDDLVLGLGPKFEVADCWPEKANIEFIRQISPDKLLMRVWERGTGETLACGTGACAAFAAARATGRVGDFAEIHLPGGVLAIRRDDRGHLLMRGPAETICEGKYFYNR